MSIKNEYLRCFYDVYYCTIFCERHGNCSVWAVARLKLSAPPPAAAATAPAAAPVAAPGAPSAAVVTFAAFVFVVPLPPLLLSIIPRGNTA